MKGVYIMIGKILILVMFALSITVLAAPTLQQRVNAEKGIADTTTAVFVDKVGQGIKQIAQDCINRTIVSSDTFISNHAVVSQSQIDEWALRALKGGMNAYMIPMIMDDRNLANPITGSSDNQIRNAIKACLWPWISLIGIGSF